jgi:hypothetical protein
MKDLDRRIRGHACIVGSPSWWVVGVGDRQERASPAARRCCPDGITRFAAASVRHVDAHDASVAVLREDHRDEALLDHAHVDKPPVGEVVVQRAGLPLGAPGLSADRA